MSPGDPFHHAGQGNTLPEGGPPPVYPRPLLPVPPGCAPVPLHPPGPAVPGLPPRSAGVPGGPAHPQLPSPTVFGAGYLRSRAVLPGPLSRAVGLGCLNPPRRLPPVTVVPGRVAPAALRHHDFRMWRHGPAPPAGCRGPSQPRNRPAPDRALIESLNSSERFFPASTGCGRSPDRWTLGSIISPRIPDWNSRT